MDVKSLDPIKKLQTNNYGSYHFKTEIQTFFYKKLFDNSNDDNNDSLFISKELYF